jgi:hypothetical protein
MRTRVCIPDPHCIVIGARDDSLAIGRESDRPDQISVALEWPCDSLACVRIPDPHCFVSRARDDSLAIGRESDRPDPISVAMLEMVAKTS